MKNCHSELSRKDVKVNLIFFSRGCILILFGKVLNSHSLLLLREDNCKCGWCMQHPKSVFLTKTLIFSFLIPASLFITCGFHKQQIVAEELFIITKDLYTFQCQNATFYHEHFSKGLLSLSIRLLNCVLWLQIPILDIHKKGTYS